MLPSGCTTQRVAPTLSDAGSGTMIGLHPRVVIPRVSSSLRSCHSIRPFLGVAGGRPGRGASAPRHVVRAAPQTQAPNAKKPARGGLLWVFCFGNDLLSQGENPSIIGSVGLNFGVRNGNRCTPNDTVTKTVCESIRRGSPGPIHRIKKQ